MTRSARELAYQSARWAKAKACGVDKMLRRGSDPARDPTPGLRALGAGRNIAANPPVLGHSSSDRRCSRRGSHPHGPRKP